MVDPNGKCAFLITGAIGAVYGGIVGGLAAWCDGGDVWQGALQGAMIGGLVGSGVGALANWVIGAEIAGTAFAGSSWASGEAAGGFAAQFQADLEAAAGVGEGEANTSGLRL